MLGIGSPVLFAMDQAPVCYLNREQGGIGADDMTPLLIRWVLSALVFVLIAYLVPDIQVTLGAAFVAAIVAGFVNALIRPIVVALTLPITLLTLGLFLLVINVALFWLTTLLVPGLEVDSLGAAIVGTVLYWLFNLVISMLIGRRATPKVAR